MKTKGHKVPQMYMQILEWCITINTTNGFETLHKFIEEEKCLLGCFQCDGCNGKSEGTAYLKM